MRRRSALGAAAFCLAFAGFQIALSLGAPLGEVAWGGSSAVLSSPMRLASAAAAAYLVVAAGLMAARGGLWAWGQGWARWPLFAFNIFLAVQLALNTAANLAATSGGERFGMGAASALGCLLCLAALWPVRRA